MPTPRPFQPEPADPTSDQGKVEISYSAQCRFRELVEKFERDLEEMADKFMSRRNSKTRVEVDVDEANGWLTRPPRKSIWRDGIASLMVFVAAGVMSYGVNLLSGDRSSSPGWFLTFAGIATALLAEVFRRWEYD